MNPQPVLALSIFVILLFLLAIFASRPEPEAQPVEVTDESPFWFGLCFWGFWISWALLTMKNAGAMP